MNRRYRALRILTAALLAWATEGVAELVWERTVLEVRAAPLQAEVDVEFTFVNRGSSPVRITGIQTNCECLEAKANRPAYEPGARGVLQARFTTGDRLGLYERAILVETDASKEPIRLAVKVDVPAAAELAPRSFDWPVGGETTAREAELVVAPTLAIEFTEVVVTGPDFAAQLRAREPGRRYVISVSPRSTDRRASAALRIRGRDGSGREIVVSGYAFVR